VMTEKMFGTIVSAIKGATKLLGDTWPHAFMFVGGTNVIVFPLEGLYYMYVQGVGKCFRLVTPSMAGSDSSTMMAVRCCYIG
jgi:hypothetical protein